MKVTGFNRLSIGTKNLAEPVKFHESVLGMQTIPSFNSVHAADDVANRPRLKAACRAR